MDSQRNKPFLKWEAPQPTLAKLVPFDEVLFRRRLKENLTGLRSKLFVLLVVIFMPDQKRRFAFEMLDLLRDHRWSVWRFGK